MNRALLRRSAVAAALIVFVAGFGVFAKDGGNEKLEEQMSVFRRTTRALGKSIGDKSKTAESLQGILAMQEAAQKAKLLEPSKAKGLEGKEKEEFIRGFRSEMIELQEQLLKIESHLVKGENDKAKEAFQGLRGIQKEGHQRYKD
ncbi:MAG: hypothetical protein KDC38_18160 [Planctomycetes bacterium]|nr:hypothetical protein [Planctomycetota bacterium]